jgi:signal transduction histidine kinase/CheY-like chemotaxis protein
MQRLTSPSRLEQWFRQATMGEVKPRVLLNICLLVLIGNNLTFYLLPGAPYDTDANLWASLGLALSLVVARHDRGFAPAVHAMLLSAWMLLAYIAVYTGGINSPALIWMTVVPLPALLLLGRPSAFFWLCWVLCGYGLLYLGSRLGWWPASLGAAQGHLVWVWLNQSLCVVSLMLLIRIYERLHVHQLDAIDGRNQELRSTHQALEVAQAHKEEFVAAVGHELRTPMNAILGLNGVLRDQVLDRPDDVEVVDHIRRSTQQLLSVVNNILDYSQLQAGQLMLQPDWLDVRSTLTAVLDAYQDKAMAREQTLGMQVDQRLPEHVWLDRLRLTQVLGNLLDNAIKYSPPGGAVTVHVGSRGDWLRIDVRDNGPGVSVHEAPHIFDRFHKRSMEAVRYSSGTGLGLSICQQLVHMQGGRIGVDAADGGGAVFWFELPMESPTEFDLAALAQQSKIGPQTPISVLLVDDDAVNLMVARLQLKKTWPAAEITSASSAREAIGLLAEHSYDVALLDMIMPEISGLELAQWIRRHSRAEVAQMPVLGLTASTHPDDWERCRAAGMDGVMVKPMDPVETTRTIRRHVRRGRKAKP